MDHNRLPVVNNRWKRDGDNKKEPFNNRFRKSRERQGSNSRFSSLKGEEDNRFLSNKPLSKNSRWKREDEGNSLFHTKDRRRRVRRGRSNFPFNRKAKPEKKIFKMNNDDFPTLGGGGVVKSIEIKQNWREAAIRGKAAPAPPKSVKKPSEKFEWHHKKDDDDVEVNWSDYEKEADDDSIDNYDPKEYDPTEMDSNDER